MSNSADVNSGCTYFVEFYPQLNYELDGYLDSHPVADEVLIPNVYKYADSNIEKLHHSGS